MSEWISVEDGMPKTEVTVLTYREKERFKVALGKTIRIASGGITWRFLNCAYQPPKGTVTHWMPLPEPPK